MNQLFSREPTEPLQESTLFPAAPEDETTRYMRETRQITFPGLIDIDTGKTVVIDVHPVKFQVRQKCIGEPAIRTRSQVRGYAQHMAKMMTEGWDL